MSGAPPLRAMMRPLGALLAVVVVFLPAAEVTLRLVFPEGVVLPPSEIAYRFDPEVGVALRPSQDKSYEPQDGRAPVVWRTNDEGFRGGPLRPSPGLRVMVYGDSNVQARFSPLEETFPFQLERRLREGGVDNPEVINAGLVGAGPDQSLLRIRRDHGRFRPDWVILHVFADNDFGDLVRNRLFDLTADGRLARSPHPVAPDRLLLGPYAWDNLLLLRALRRIRRTLGASDEDSTWSEAVSRRCDEEYAVFAAGRPRAFSHFADHYDVDLASQPKGAAGRAKVALMAGIIDRAAKLAEEGDFRLLVLIQPARDDVTGRIAESLGDRWPEYRQDNLTAAVVQACESAGAAYVDLFQPFRRGGAAALYFEDRDSHWNGKGQALAAQHAARHLLEADGR